ncbi:MAG: HAD family hydrolase [Spirochaetae bacterium HGW-Spirochaetae-5]|nr:MAG: HAD family hydrolase [Spirochaetae bacterium HGW-Spirochaetae-5]
MNNFKAVVFDLDGTLLDTIDDLGNSMNTVLASMGYPIHTIPEYKYFIGKGLRNLVTSVLPAEARDDKTIEHCLDKMFQEYGGRWGEMTLPYPGISELLDELTSRGIRLAILSNKAHLITMKVFDKYLSRWTFDAVFGERPGIPRKPDPTAALEIIEMLQIPAEQIVYLGDSGSDMETANSAGMYAVGALWGFRNAEELMEHGAKLMIQSPEELLKLF